VRNHLHFSTNNQLNYHHLKREREKSLGKRSMLLQLLRMQKIAEKLQNKSLKFNKRVKMTQTKIIFSPSFSILKIPVRPRISLVPKRVQKEAWNRTKVKTQKESKCQITVFLVPWGLNEMRIIYFIDKYYKIILDLLT